MKFQLPHAATTKTAHTMTNTFGMMKFATSGKEQTMSELKPCPFCGSKAEVYEECEMVKIRCSSYMCQASVNGWHDEVEDAIEAWNRRADDD